MIELQKHQDWPAVKEVCEVLENSGYRAWLAGGCVRDGLLQRSPKDFDVVTDARPEQVEALFAKTIPVGKSFGVIIVVHQGVRIEVATFRRDGCYLDGRHPDKIDFAQPEDDANRRDFTINALFYDLRRHTVIDLVGGQSDLRSHLLQTVGDAQRRYTEDRLRMLRAVRFAAQLNFSLETETFASLQRLHRDFLPLSPERIKHELDRLLESPHPPYGLALLLESGLAQQLLGSWSEEVFKSDLQGISPWQRTQVLFSRSWPKAERAEMWSLLWWPLVHAKALDLAAVGQIFKTLRLSNVELREVVFLLELFMKICSNQKEDLPDLVEAQAHSKLTFVTQVVEIWGPIIGVHFDVWSEAQHLSSWVLVNGQLPEPLLRGEDIMSAGWQGHQVGSLLRQVRRRQLLGELRSKKAALLWLKQQTSPSI